MPASYLFSWEIIYALRGNGPPANNHGGSLLASSTVHSGCTLYIISAVTGQQPSIPTSDIYTDSEL